jgi:hypothetical protein
LSDQHIEWDFDAGAALEDMSFSAPQPIAQFRF